MDKIFKSLADKNRRKILVLLKDQEKSVNTILDGLDITQATLSSHLAILRKAGLVKYRVFGKQRIYRMDCNLLAALAKEIDNLANVKDKILPEEIISRKKSDF